MINHWWKLSLVAALHQTPKYSGFSYSTSLSQDRNTLNDQCYEQILGHSLATQISNESSKTTTWMLYCKHVPTCLIFIQQFPSKWRQSSCLLIGGRGGCSGRDVFACWAIGVEQIPGKVGVGWIPPAGSVRRKLHKHCQINALWTKTNKQTTLSKNLKNSICNAFAEYLTCQTHFSLIIKFLPKRVI